MEEELPNSLKALEEDLATWRKKLLAADEKVNQWNEKVEAGVFGTPQQPFALSSSQQQARAIAVRETEAQQMVLALMAEKDRQAEHLGEFFPF
ncbi:hypothetical protein BASA62_004619 [Batrachochytrium salamandrivorans]|nr:hypothetical protein BASA62_004619 [Batrachochytrium salamandrivorans]